MSLSTIATGSDQTDPSHWAKLLHPRQTSTPIPHPRLPEAAKSLYLEAQAVFDDSPRSAAVLLRIATERLVEHIGIDNSKNLNAKISALRGMGIDERTTKILDVLRVFGGEAAHAKTLRLNEDPQEVAVLFELVNHIAQVAIATSAKVDAMFGNLPQSIRDAIKKRDEGERNKETAGD